MWRGALRKQYLCRYHPEENPKVWKLREANIRCPVEGPGGLKLCQACILMYMYISHACIYAHASSSARHAYECICTYLACLHICTCLKLCQEACAHRTSLHGYIHIACMCICACTCAFGMYICIYIYHDRRPTPTAPICIYIHYDRRPTPTAPSSVRGSTSPTRATPTPWAAGGLAPASSEPCVMLATQCTRHWAHASRRVV